MEPGNLKPRGPSKLIDHAVCDHPPPPQKIKLTREERILKGIYILCIQMSIQEKTNLKKSLSGPTDCLSGSKVNVPLPTARRDSH